jgi:isoquinoline 1-oxidoreductase alpha subunit
MAAFQIKVNGQSHSVDVWPDTPVLWVLRDNLGLTGTKYGCGIAQCGACTVFLDGQPLRSCSLPVSGVGDSEITTIEGLNGREAGAVQKAWIAHDSLPVGTDHERCGFAQTSQEAERSRHRSGDEWQYLPLRDICPHSCSDP